MLWKDVGTWRYKSKDQLDKKDAFFFLNEQHISDTLKYPQDGGDTEDIW